MTSKSKIISHIDEFREHKNQWNDLWARNGTSVANHRAEIVELNAKRFYNPKSFRSIVVYQGDRMVAGMPLAIERRLAISTRANSLGNPCSPFGTILFDPEVDFEFVSKEMGGLIRQLGTNFLRLDWLQLDDRNTQRLCEIAVDNSLIFRKKSPQTVAVIEVPHDGDVLKHTSSNHRKKLRRWQRDLESRGKLSLSVLESTTPDRTREAFAAALEIERRSWKGIASTAILQNENECLYWTEWAEALLASGHLNIFLLQVGDVQVAFDIGYTVGDTYSSVKISHIDELESIGVGHVRDWLLIEHFASQKKVSKIDTIAASATIKWPSSSYSVGKLLISSGSWLGDTQVGLTGILDMAIQR